MGFESRGTILQAPIHNWYCPNCPATSQTREFRPHSRFHSCPGLKGMTAPMFDELTNPKVKVEAHMREDYIGDDIVQTDEDGRPVMSVVTTREDGTDTIVFAPTAVLKANKEAI